MKKLKILIAILTLPFLSLAQIDAPPDLQAYFSATIVKDIDSSINWYSSMLGFEAIDKIESEERGFRQSNLRRENILIELIELNNAVSASEVVPDYTSKTRMLGFFKTGFIVSDFTQWMNHLNKQKANFYGNIVEDENGKRMAIILDPDGNRIQIFEK